MGYSRVAGDEKGFGKVKDGIDIATGVLKIIYGGDFTGDNKTSNPQIEYNKSKYKF